MNVQLWQVILIVLLAAIKNVDTYGTQWLAFQHITFAWLTGLVLGDPTTGLAVGSTVQLMSLGVAGLGGSSVPDYGIAGMVGTVVAITTGQDASVGLAVGIAVGMLGVQLDILFKIFNGFVAQRSEAYMRAGNYKAMLNILWAGPVFFGLIGAVPMLIVLAFGADAVNAVLNALPAWFMSGLKIAGGLLPVVGMAMLLNFMPAKKFISFVIVGYVLASFAKLSILPIALLGVAAAYEYYKLHAQSVHPQVEATVQGGLEDE